MSAVKKVWITKHDGGLVSLSLESETVEPGYMRLHVTEAEFPETPSKKFPKRHTLSIKLLDESDLQEIAERINTFLYDREN